MSCLWFTGLSGSGKTTLSTAVARKLNDCGLEVIVLDGDVLRQGICSDLGFSLEDRIESQRRIAEMAKVIHDAGATVIVATISPLQIDRDRAYEIIGEPFYEVYCKCSLEACEARDVKGLYKKARANEVKEFTGISSPYEAPKFPDLVVDTEVMTIQECVEEIAGWFC
jgi:adenylylsulfate kinase